MISYTQNAGIAQLVERGPEKPGVPSATLGPGTTHKNIEISPEFYAREISTFLYVVLRYLTNESTTVYKFGLGEKV